MNKLTAILLSLAAVTLISCGENQSYKMTDVKSGEIVRIAFSVDWIETFENVDYIKHNNQIFKLQMEAGLNPSFYYFSTEDIMDWDIINPFEGL